MLNRLVKGLDSITRCIGNWYRNHYAGRPSGGHLPRTIWNA